MRKPENQPFGEDTGQFIAAREDVRGIFARVLSWRRPVEELEVVTEDGRGVVLWQGRPTSLGLRCIDHRWYFSYAEPASQNEECEYFALMVGQQTRKLRLLAKGIKAGDLSEEDVEAALDGRKVLPGERAGSPQGILRVQMEGIGD